MDIRKIYIGPDYKSSAMHYLLGQEILNGNFIIHLIKQEESSIVIYIQKEDEVLLWKRFNSSMPMSIEYNINF